MAYFWSQQTAAARFAHPWRASRYRLVSSEQAASVLASGRDASLATTNALAGKGHWSTCWPLMTRRAGSERIHEALRDSESHPVHELSCTVFSFNSGTRAIGSIAVILAKAACVQLAV